jgi:hypothetical protein
MRGDGASSDGKASQGQARLPDPKTVGRDRSRRMYEVSHENPSASRIAHRF